MGLRLPPIQALFQLALQLYRHLQALEDYMGLQINKNISKDLALQPFGHSGLAGGKFTFDDRTHGLKPLFVALVCEVKSESIWILAIL